MPTRNKGSILAFWILLLVGALSIYWDPLASLGPRSEGLFYLFYAHYLFKIQLAYEAGRLLGQEKENGMLEILLTTPINNGMILRGKKASLRRRFLPPLTFVLILHAWFVIIHMYAYPNSVESWFGLSSAIVLTFDYYSVGWVGLWQGLRCKNSYRAFLRTLINGLAVPWLPFFALTTLLWFILGKGFEPAPSFMVALGITSATIFGLSAGLYALARVHFELRRRVAERG